MKSSIASKNSPPGCAIATPPSRTRTPTFLPGICRRTPRSAFPSRAIPFEMSTQPVTLVTMLEATSRDSVGTFVGEVLDGSGWQVEAVRRRGSRLEPPHGYWATYEISVKRDSHERKLRLPPPRAVGRPGGGRVRKPPPRGESR